MQIEIFTVCPDANLNKGNLTIFGAFNNNTICAKKFPARMSVCVVLKTRFEPGEEGDHKLEIILTDADLHPIMHNGKPINFIKNLKIDFLKNSLGQVDVRTVKNKEGLYVEKAGDYYFELKIDGHIRGSVPVYVRQAI